MSLSERRLGSQGLVVSAEGLGCVGMSTFYGRRDDAESIATLEAALDAGVTLFDTAETYADGANETLIGRVLAARRDEVVLASKFGLQMNPDGTRSVVGTPAAVRTAIDGSLSRLGVDTIDLYYQHRVDPNVPIEETVGAMAELVIAGKVRYLGLCEVGPDDLRRAHAEYPISAVQSEYSLFSRSVESNGVLAALRELGIGFVPYSPLGRGFLTGMIRSLDDLPANDFRRHLPRFQGDNLARNLALVDRIAELAAAKGVTTSQFALAWVLAQGNDIVPIPGTKRRTYLAQNLAALDVAITPADEVAIEAVVPAGAVMGERNTPVGMETNYE
ncbi:MAG: aldo/keto reductase [Acidimicrobiia bacterium]